MARSLVEQLARRRFPRAGRRPVVVGEVEVGHAEVEGLAQDGAPRLERRRIAEIVPQAKRDRRQFETAAAEAVVGHRVVTGGAALKETILLRIRPAEGLQRRASEVNAKPQVPLPNRAQRV